MGWVGEIRKDEKEEERERERESNLVPQVVPYLWYMFADDWNARKIAFHVIAANIYHR